MAPEIWVLSGTAAIIAFVHTVLGPDHYLPFVALARARRWTLRKTLAITLWCGLGHLVGSIALGAAGLFLGTAVSHLIDFEAVRGEVAAWLLCGFGLAYMAWGLRRAWRRRPHTHWHQHGEVLHQHPHGHLGAHAHVHERERQGGLTPWVVFVIFVLGPCEPLIPLLMYPAATHSIGGMLLVTGVFGAVTVLTMLAAVALAHAGLQRLRLGGLHRFAHAFAGLTLFACGAGMVLFGL